MQAAENVLRMYALAMIHTAAAWDLLGASRILPRWWPPVGYVLIAAGIAAGCVAVLLAVLTARRNRGVSSQPPAAHGTASHSPPLRARMSAGGQLLSLGILLAAWLLRGHAEIPPDPPLVAAGILGAALYTLFAVRRGGRSRDTAD